MDIPEEVTIKMNTPMRLLIVDDEPQLLDLLSDFFEPTGCDIRKASSGTEAIELIERERFDVILTDLKMPGPDGIEVLRIARKIQSDAEVVMMTGFATVDTAIEAMRAGAFHYLMKPFKGQEVVNLVQKAYAHRQLRRENQFLKSEFRGEHQIHAMVGTSTAMQEMIAATARLADTDTPRLPDDLFVLGIKWRFLAAKGFDYSEERAAYDMSLNRFHPRDTVTENISLGMRGGINTYLNMGLLPAGNWPGR